jgi:hypothetical protein
VSTSEVCGGSFGNTCSAGEYCEYFGNCGAGQNCTGIRDVCAYIEAGAVGVCHPLPYCSTPAEMICGCDGVTYESDCARRAASVGYDHAGPCSGGVGGRTGNVGGAGGGGGSTTGGAGGSTTPKQGGAGGSGGAGTSGRGGGPGGSGGTSSTACTTMCFVDFPCSMTASAGPNCVTGDPSVVATGRNVSCQEACGTPCCSGGGCQITKSPCPTGTVCAYPAGSSTAKCLDTAQVCGGPSGKSCAANEYCEYFGDPCPNGATTCNGIYDGCGYIKAGAAGVCRPIPADSTCATPNVAVCGCDGVTYKNDCARKAASVGLAYGGACVGGVGGRTGSSGGASGGSVDGGGSGGVTGAGGVGGSLDGGGGDGGSATSTSVRRLQPPKLPPGAMHIYMTPALQYPDAIRLP